MLSFFAGISVLLGVFFIVTAALGLVRFPDFWTRIHAVSVGDAVGLPFIFLGIALASESWHVAGKLCLATVFLWITSATATHALAAAAFHEKEKETAGAKKKKPAA